LKEVEIAMADGSRAVPTEEATLQPRIVTVDVSDGSWFTRERISMVAVLVVVLAVWEAAGRIVGTFFLPPPTSLVGATRELVASGDLFRELAKSLQTLGVGYRFSALVGVGFGFVCGWYKLVGRVASPFINALYVVPVSALVPLVIVWFGLGIFPRILVVFLFSVFEILIASMNGVANVDRTIVEVARSFGVRSQWDMFRKIVFFNALPFVFTGLRIGASRAVKGMIIGELLFAVTGIGGLIDKYSNAYRTDIVFVLIVVITLLGVAVNYLVQLLHARIAPWNQ